MMKNIVLGLAVMMTAVSCKKENPETETPATDVSEERILTIGGSVTEIVSALGYQNQIVGVDVKSTAYPENITETAQDLGHIRSITIEPVMALNPTLVLASAEEVSGNSDLWKKIQDAGIRSEMLNQEYTIEGTKNLISRIAEMLGHSDYQPLLDKIDKDMAGLTPMEKKPKVLFIYSHGGGNLMVAGKNTSQQSLIALAGGENVISDFDGFKTLTTESLVQDNPDVILMFDTGLEGVGGREGLTKVPGISQTNAGKNGKIITMDGALVSNFGPRVGEAALELNKKLIEATQ